MQSIINMEEIQLSPNVEVILTVRINVHVKIGEHEGMGHDLKKKRDVSALYNQRGGVNDVGVE